MAHIFRLVALFLALWSGPALSAVPFNYFARVNVPEAEYTNAAPTIAAACTGLPTVAPIPGRFGMRNFTQGAGNWCDCQLFSADEGFISAGNSCAAVYYGHCPENSILVNGECVCSGGNTESGGKCGPAPNEQCKGLSEWCSDKKGFRTDFEGRGEGSDFFCHSAENFIAGAGGGSSAWEPAFPGCNKGCMISSGSVSISAKDDSGQWWTSGNGKYVGSTCDPNVINKLNEGTTDEKEVKPTETKKPGKCNGQQGTYNGVEVCLPYNEVKGDDKTKTENKSDGTKKETTTKTTCTFSQCSIETKVVDKDKSGNTTGTNTSVVNVSKDEYCARNAGSAVCKGLNPDDKSGSGGSGGGGGGGGGKGDKDEEEKEKGSFAGSCQAGFKCEGDALQCAIAREQHRRNCDLWEKDTDSGSLTNRALNGTDDKSADTMKANAQQVTVGTFDQAGLGWSSSCPADPSIPLNFGGTSSEFTIPFSRICGPLSILSMAGVGITLLGCMVWVLGDKKAA